MDMLECENVATFAPAKQTKNKIKKENRMKTIAKKLTMMTMTVPFHKKEIKQ